MEKNDVASILVRLQEVVRELKALTGPMNRIDSRLARIEAALNRLEGPLTLDAGSEIEDEVTIH